jgi:hypothetical protein
MFWWSRKKPLSTAQRWALAAGGILTRRNSEPFDELRFKCGRAASRGTLRDWWEAANADELTKILDWLYEEGHRAGCARLCDSPTLSRNRPFDAGTEDPSDLYTFVSANLSELKASGLVAWDLSRLVNVARWGYTADFIQEAEAWNWLFRAARKLQQSFDSWKALGQDFLLGVEFWMRSNQIAVKFDDLRKAHEWLLSDAESPWRQLPWTTPLSE